jgi:hypothetical protein
MATETGDTPAYPTVSEIYKEQYAHFRSMNDILYKIPPLFGAVIGGLWYVALQNLSSDRWLARAVLLFAGLSCVGFVQVMQRFSMAFKLYIRNLNKLDGAYAVKIDGGFSTIDVIKTMLWVAAAGSGIAVVYSFYK